MGLVAAALGIERPETVKDERRRVPLDLEHHTLAAGYGMAVKLELIGSRLVDYHTAQVPSSGTGRNRRTFPTRRDEICGVARSELHTVLSRRDYRQDAFAAVALWARDDAPYSLERLRDALKAPRFVLYLGRKSCPIALPLAPEVVEAPCIEEALARMSFVRATDGLWDESGTAQRIADRMTVGTAMLCWDTDAAVRIDTYQTVTRRDEVLSRRRWQFAVREERQGFPVAEGGA